jgi:uncharacterized protein YbjT (DUF2867 family)
VLSGIVAVAPLATLRRIARARRWFVRLVLLGASGGVGKELVKQAREAGHDVTPVTRASSSYDGPRRTGDLTDPEFLAAMFQGADAVLSGLGCRMPGIAPWHRPEVPDFLSRSTPAIVAAAKKAGVNRIVAVSAGGVGDSARRVPGVFRAFIRVSALRHAYAELEVMERVYLDSGLDVCLPRPGGLNDGPRTGKAVAVDVMKGAEAISRADVAAYMLGELDHAPFRHRAPLIGVR